jgi:hypothetical protein
MQFLDFCNHAFGVPSTGLVTDFLLLLRIPYRLPCRQFVIKEEI